MKLRAVLPAAVTAAIILAAGTVPALAQSLFATRGLGLPIQPLDARARALGGVGTGLLGINTSLVNPADAIGLTRRAIGASVQPTGGEAELNGETGEFGATRFPSVRLIIPLGTRFGLSVGYGSVLEQSWALETTGETQIGDETIETRDLIEADGGVSRVEIGLAFAITQSLAIGAAGGVYAGQLERSIRRAFVDPDILLAPFEQKLRFGFSGPHATVGARWNPIPVLRLGAAFTLGDNLEVDVEEGSAAGEDWRLPMRLNAGVSGLLTPELALAVGAERAWGADDEPIAGASVRADTWRLGGGLEYTGLRTSSHLFPIRLGYANEDLPYHLETETPATERAFTFGLGIRFGGVDGGTPNAVVDAALERGERTGLESTRNPGGLTESFWRMTFSLTLLGF